MKTLILACLALPCLAPSATVYVDGRATGLNTGSSWTHAFTDLQDALAVTLPGDRVWVAEGTYLPSQTGTVSASFRIPDGVSLYGGFAGNELILSQRRWDLHPTILSGDLGQDDLFGNGAWYVGWNIVTPNSTHVVTVDSSVSESSIDGFKIAQGHGSSGAGMAILGGRIRISSCEFWRNMAGFSKGGGLSIQDGFASVTGCKFTQNWCHLGSGGGIYVGGTGRAIISNSEFYENHCTGDASSGNGAGIEFWTTSPSTVVRCLFRYNQALPFGSSAQGYGTYGGGIHNFGSPLTVEQCRFEDNTSMQGGGIFSWKDLVVRSSLFARNHAYAYNGSGGSVGGLGGAICAYNFSTLAAFIVGCTLVNNTAHETGGMWLRPTTSTVSTSIFWNNSDVNGTYHQAQLSGTRASRCCIFRLWDTIPGEDPIDPEKFPYCFDLDPQFSGTSIFTLRATSPCLDAGDRTAFPPSAFQRDAAGGNRFVDDAAPDTGLGPVPLPDIGSFERQRPEG